MACTDRPVAIRFALDYFKRSPRLSEDHMEVVTELDTGSRLRLIAVGEVEGV